ncbi:MAG: AAA family ATPase [Anaerolineales bacterium]|nr:AAA family ATPase [Anaerolineales bacterium]
MTRNHQYRFWEVEIDSSLLSFSKGIQTNWHVITGAPCSGKTTLIETLTEHGFDTGVEIGRLYISSELANGRTLAEVRADELAFQRTLLELRLKREQGLDPARVTFLDRGLPDSITFYRANGLNPNEILTECQHYRYASVFLLDRLPLQSDGVRAEDDKALQFIDEWLFRDYTALGYDIFRVPVLPIEQRLKFVLERVPK